MVCLLKDLIKVRSWQVLPTELEDTLTSHAEIKEAAVVGVTGSLTDGEKPRAFIVRQGTDSQLTIGEVLSFHEGETYPI